MVNAPKDGSTGILTAGVVVVSFFIGLTEYIELQQAPLREALAAQVARNSVRDEAHKDVAKNVTRLKKFESDFKHHDGLYHLLDARVRITEQLLQAALDNYRHKGKDGQ